MNVNIEKDSAATYPLNGNLRVYNQFPRRYSNGLTEMIEQLPEIKAMGFNAMALS